MAGVEFIVYKGRRILYEDYSNSNPEDVLPLLDRAKEMIAKEPENSVLALVNVKGSVFDRQISNAMKEFVKANTPYIKCSAIIGLEGIQEVIYKGIIAFTGRKNLIVFRDEIKAKEHLIGLE